MTKDLIDLDELRDGEYVASAYFVQWFRKYFDQDEVSAFILAGLEERQRSPEAFREFVRFYQSKSDPILSGEHEPDAIMHLKEYPEIERAYLQYLLRDKLRRYMRSKERISPLPGLAEEHDLVPFLVSTKIREKFFDPVFLVEQEYFPGGSMCDDLGLDYDQVVREHVLLNSIPLDKLWRIVRIRPIEFGFFFDAVLGLAEKNDFSPSALVVKKCSTLKQDESGEAFFFPPRISLIIDWVKDLLTKTSLSPDEISTLRPIVERNRSYFNHFPPDELEDLLMKGTNSPFPKLLAAALSVESDPRDLDLVKMCENHWDDSLLCALLAYGNLSYSDYPLALQEKFVRMCQVAGIKAEVHQTFAGK